MKPYIALIHKDAETDFGVSFPDFPGCVSAGATLDEARAMAVEAIALHIEGMIEDGDAIPEPSSLEVVMADSENRDGVAVLIDVPAIGTESVRIDVTLPQDVLLRVDRDAARRGVSRSDVLVDAANSIIPRKGILTPPSPRLPQSDTMRSKGRNADAGWPKMAGCDPADSGLRPGAGPATV